MVFYKNVQRNTYRETPEDWDSSPFSQHFILKMNKTLQCFFFNMVLILWNQGKKGKKKNPPLTIKLKCSTNHQSDLRSCRPALPNAQIHSFHDKALI